MLGGTCLSPAHGAESTIEPRVNASLSYTDNLYLAAPSEAESDVVGQVNPGVSVKGTGARASGSLDYRMQNLFYDNVSEADDTRHQLAATARGELVRQRLFLDANASFTQRTISETGIQDPENITPTSDQTDVASYTVSPSWQRRFNAATSASVRYSIGEVRYLEDTVSGNDALNQTFDLEVNRTPQGRNFTSMLYFRSTNVQYDTAAQADSRFRQAGVDVRYPVGSATTLLASGGYEANTYQKALADDETDGVFWKAGVSWKPSRTTSLDLTIGRRFYGATPSLALTHQAARLTLRASYSEDFSTSSLLQAGTPTFDEQGNPIFDATNPSISTDVWLDKNFRADIFVRGRLSTLTLGAYHSDRDSQTGDRTEKRAGFNAGWSTRLGRRTDFSLTGNVQRNNYDDGQSSYADRNARAAFTHRLQRDLDGVLSYSYLGRGAQTDVPGYHRNLIKADVTLKF